MRDRLLVLFVRPRRSREDPLAILRFRVDAVQNQRMEVKMEPQVGPKVLLEVPEQTFRRGVCVLLFVIGVMLRQRGRMRETPGELRQRGF